MRLDLDKRAQIAAMTRARNVQACLEEDGDIEEYLDPAEVMRAKRDIRRWIEHFVVAALLVVGVAGWVWRWWPW